MLSRVSGDPSHRNIVFSRMGSQAIGTSCFHMYLGPQAIGTSCFHMYLGPQAIGTSCFHVYLGAQAIGTLCFHMYLGAQAIGTSSLHAHFLRENTQKACTRSALEAQNSSSEQLLVLKGGYRRHAKNASRLDGLQVFGVDVNFIRVFTWKTCAIFHVILRIEQLLLHGRAKAPQKTHVF